MPNYRRNRIPGAAYFFTVNLRDRRSGLLVTEIDALREAVRGVRRQSPFRIDAWVVLPDHMHCLWTLPEGDSDFPDRWRRIKAAFSKSLPNTEPVSRARLRKGERGIWQRGYWEHTIRDDRDYSTHMDYTHFNPVKHELTQDPNDWLFSSFRRCVAAGLYPAGWLGGGAEPVEAGERPREKAVRWPSNRRILEAVGRVERGATRHSSVAGTAGSASLTRPTLAHEEV